MTSLLSRRTFLQRAPGAAAALATPLAIAVAEVRAEPIEDSDMKCMRLARELFNAMKAHYGEGCKMIRNEVNGSLYFAPPPPAPRIVEFAGAGWYEVEDGSPDRIELMWVDVSKFPPDPKTGRFFEACPKRTDLGIRYYEEEWLRSILIRKIGAIT